MTPSAMATMSGVGNEQVAGFAAAETAVHMYCSLHGACRLIGHIVAGRRGTCVCTDGAETPPLQPAGRLALLSSRRAQISSWRTRRITDDPKAQLLHQGVVVPARRRRRSSSAPSLSMAKSFLTTCRRSFRR